METAIIKKAQTYVSELLTDKLPEQYCYHDLAHTQRVVQAAIDIGTNSGLAEQDLEIVILAAWFHDVGYIKQAKGHETIGKQMAANFLAQEAYPVHAVKKISDCIMATQWPQNPKDPLAEILCDADMHHMAIDQYANYGELMRQEKAKTDHNEQTKADWLVANIVFFQSHHYFTMYARQHLEPGK